MQGGSYRDCSQRSWWDFFMGVPCSTMQGGNHPDFGKHPQAQEVIMGGSLEGVSLAGGGSLEGGAKRKPRKSARKVVRKNTARKTMPRKTSKRKTTSRKIASKPRKTTKASIRKSRGCNVQTQKKQATRNSPPQPANECCNTVKTGNDGLAYKSTRVGAQSACTWKRL